LQIKFVAEAQHEPEAIGEEDMVQKLSQFLVSRCSIMLTNGFQQRGIRVSFVTYEISEHLKHGKYCIKS
jgi:hypothetical protein